MIVWYTPTTGLGCRSGAYIIYGALATIVWAMMLLSSLFTHWAVQIPILPNERDGQELTEILATRRLSHISAHSGHPVMNHIHVQPNTPPQPPCSPSPQPPPVKSDLLSPKPHEQSRGYTGQSSTSLPTATDPHCREHSSAPSVDDERPMENPLDASRADEEPCTRDPATQPVDEDTELRITRPALRVLALAFRRTAKFIATCNTTGILVTSIFQFTNFFNRCYCNSSVTSRGTLYGYDVMKLLPEDQTRLINSWTGGIILSAAIAILFVFAVNLWINPPVPGGSSR